MKTYLISTINATTLILFGVWGYTVSSSPSFTAFIPVIIGVLILLSVKGIKKNVKRTVIIALILTVIVLIGLVKPLTGAMERADSASIARVITMMVTSFLSLLLIIKDLAKNRGGK